MKKSFGESLSVESQNSAIFEGLGVSRPEPVAASPSFVGNLYRIEGKLYALGADELVYDTETNDPVFDPRIYDRVFDLYGEDLQLAAEIRRKARAVARGNSAMEEALRLHFAFTGLSGNSGNPETRETQVA